MVRIGRLDIKPTLINSSCAWASDLAQLRELYRSPYTGAVTTRTATMNGFDEHCPELHTVRNLLLFMVTCIVHDGVKGCFLVRIVIIHQLLWLFASSSVQVPRMGRADLDRGRVFETHHHQYHFFRRARARRYVIGHHCSPRQNR